MSRSWRYVSATVLVVSAFALGACGDDDEGTAGPARAPDAGEVTPDATAPEPEEKVDDAGYGFVGCVTEDEPRTGPPHVLIDNTDAGDMVGDGRISVPGGFVVPQARAKYVAADVFVFLPERLDEGVAAVKELAAKVKGARVGSIERVVYAYIGEAPGADAFTYCLKQLKTADKAAQ